MFANLSQQSSTIIFIDRLIVEDSEAHVWLRENLTSQEFVGAMSNQLPGTLDHPADEIDQLFVIREEQRARSEAHIF